MNQNQQCGTGHKQMLVSQEPRYDKKIVYDRRLKIDRPTKKVKKIKWL